MTSAYLEFGHSITSIHPIQQDSSWYEMIHQLYARQTMIFNKSTSLLCITTS